MLDCFQLVLLGIRKMLKMEIPGHKRPMVGLCSPLFEAVILSLLVVSECISSSDINHLKYSKLRIFFVNSKHAQSNGTDISSYISRAKGQ